MRFAERLTGCSTNSLSEHIVEHTDMPSHLIKTVSGQQVFEQTQPRVSFTLSLSLSISVYVETRYCRVLKVVNKGSDGDKRLNIKIR